MWALAQPRGRGRQTTRREVVVSHRSADTWLMQRACQTDRFCVYMLRMHLSGSFSGTPFRIKLAHQISLGPQSSGAVWKSRWPSWVPCPNKPYGFCGWKASLNRAYALMSQFVPKVNPTTEDITLYTTHTRTEFTGRRLFSLLPAKSYFGYITVNIILFESAACIDLACLRQWCGADCKT